MPLSELAFLCAVSMQSHHKPVATALPYSPTPSAGPPPSCVQESMRRDFPKGVKNQ